MTSKLITLRRRSLIGRRRAADKSADHTRATPHAAHAVHAEHNPIPPQIDEREYRTPSATSAPHGAEFADIPLSRPAVKIERREPGHATFSAESSADQSDQSDAAKISRKFVAFAGSGANARALATGLHFGTVITLSAADAANETQATSQGASQCTFVPAIPALRYGQVFIALAMAECVLARLGVTRPQPQQIQAVLNGGIVEHATEAEGGASTLPGILHLRNRGLDWRAVARAHGLDAEPGAENGQSDLDSGGAPDRQAKSARAPVLRAMVLSLAVATLVLSLGGRGTNDTTNFSANNVVSGIGSPTAG